MSLWTNVYSKQEFLESLLSDNDYYLNKILNNQILFSEYVEKFIKLPKIAKIDNVAYKLAVYNNCGSFASSTGSYKITYVEELIEYPDYYHVVIYNFHNDFTWNQAID